MQGYLEQDNPISEACPLLVVDESVLRVMENESLLIDKDCLTLGEEIGKGTVIKVLLFVKCHCFSKMLDKCYVGFFSYVDFYHRPLH